MQVEKKKIPKKIEVQFNDLPPEIRQLIRKQKKPLSKQIDEETDLKQIRLKKNIANIAAGVGGAAFLGGMGYALSKNEIPPILFEAGGGLALLLAGKERQNYVNQLAEIHGAILSRMRKHGAIIASAVQNYSWNSGNIDRIANSHPIFYIKGNGNIVFVKRTKFEYLRWAYQQHEFFGKAGLIAWRFRQPIRKFTPLPREEEWVKQKIMRSLQWAKIVYAVMRRGIVKTELERRKLLEKMPRSFKKQRRIKRRSKAGPKK